MEVPSLPQEQIAEPQSPTIIIQDVLSGLKLKGSKFAIILVEEEESTIVVVYEIQPSLKSKRIEASSVQFPTVRGLRPHPFDQ